MIEAAAETVSIESEQMVIGGLLLQPSAYDQVSDILETEDFYELVHQEIFEEIKKATNSGQVISAHALSKRFETHPALEQVGRGKYIIKLCTAAVTINGLPDLAKLVADLHKRRKLHAAAHDIGLMATDTLGDIDYLSEAERIFNDAIDSSATGSTELSGSDALGEAIDKIVSGEADPISTGLEDLDKQMGGFYPQSYYCLAGRTSMGKAQPLTSKVLLDNGHFKTMGEITRGDKLASVDGLPSEVLGVFPQGNRKVYKITTSDGRSTRACGEHLWEISSAHFDGDKVVSTSRLREMVGSVRYKNRIKLPLASGDFGGWNGLKIDPWLLGILLGDGCFSKGTLVLSTPDAEVLFKVQKILGHDAITTSGGYDYRVLKTKARWLYEALSEYGLLGLLSHQKYIPEPYFGARRETRMQIARGMLDSDGHVTNCGVVQLSTASLRMAKDFQRLIWSLGGACTLKSKRSSYKKDGQRVECKTSYTCNIRHQDRQSFLTLTKKKRRCTGVHLFKKPTIISVEEDGVERVQCIKVSHQSSLYITDDYIVTHNTALGLSIARNVARQGKGVLIVSLEMPKRKLMVRMACDHLWRPDRSLHYNRILSGKVNQSDICALHQAKRDFESWPLVVDDAARRSVHSIKALVRRTARKMAAQGTKLEFVLIDYLGKIKHDMGRSGNLVQAYADTSVNLSQIAKDNDLAVLALHQVNRATEGRDDKRPKLSDLRHSGDIEQDVDCAIFIYREHYYLNRMDPNDVDIGELRSSEHQAEVIIEKNRDGATGTALISCDMASNAFRDKGVIT